MMLAVLLRLNVRYSNPKNCIVHTKSGIELILLQVSCHHTTPTSIWLLSALALVASKREDDAGIPTETLSWTA